MLERFNAFNHHYMTVDYANEPLVKLKTPRVVRARLRPGAQQTNEYDLEREFGRLITNIKMSKIK